MSADLLRRAAAKLRETAAAASWPDGWTADLDESEVTSLDAEYIALMHPPVALAVADWLDDAAREAAEIGPNPWAVACARAVLREEQP